MILFNILLFFVCILGFLIILLKNPIHSILYLILSFFISSCALILLHLEFLAMIFLIIYIGAISILFLFIIMMLNIRLIETGENKIKYLPFSILFFVLLLIQLYFFLFIENNSFNFFNFYELSDLNSKIEFLEYLASLIYVGYLEYFLLSGLILFLAMIGVITLTLTLNYYVKKQDLFLQINRDFNKSIIIKTK